MVSQYCISGTGATERSNYIVKDEFNNMVFTLWNGGTTTNGTYKGTATKSPVKINYDGTIRKRSTRWYTICRSNN